MDHAMIPQLVTFLCDHTRSAKYLFPKLKRKTIFSTYYFAFPVLFRFSVKTSF